MTTADRLQKLLDYRYGERLQLGTARLAATGEPVAVVVTVEQVAPGAPCPIALGVLRPVDATFLDQHGAPTAAARAAFETLKVKASDADNETWFSEDLGGHVHVGFEKPGTTREEQKVLITLAWQDPEQLFEATELAR